MREIIVDRTLSVGLFYKLYNCLEFCSVLPSFTHLLGQIIREADKANLNQGRSQGFIYMYFFHLLPV